VAPSAFVAATPHALPALRARSCVAHASRTLHVAALPFPSPQGTQAAIASMLRALCDAGEQPRLLTYAHGAPDGAASELPIRRADERFPYRSLRSGPSLHKLAADWALRTSLQRELLEWRPSLVVAHHVEAAALSLLSGTVPRVFFAHTDLAAELPSYAASALGPLLQRCGSALDRELVRRSTAVAAVSPWLAERLRAYAPDGLVHYVPVPWTVAPPTTLEERTRARAELAIGTGEVVLGYAGNLDAYQGWPVLIELLCRLRGRGHSARLLVATASEHARLLREATAAGVASQLSVLPLRTEGHRRRVHAALDLAIVPRRARGGVSIKLLDALSRGVPCVASRTASAGLPLCGAAEVAAGDDAFALTATVEALLRAPERAAQLRARGPLYIEDAHAPRVMVHELRTLVADVRREQVAALARD
jgi:glycosyltransferase involved in cell wall biosynthesis